VCVSLQLSLSRAPQHGTTLGRLCPVHRLDRNVSGLLVFARGAAAANALRIQIQARRQRAAAPPHRTHAPSLTHIILLRVSRQAGDVVKEYVACVMGTFPDGRDGAPAFVVDAPLLYDYKARARRSRGGWHGARGVGASLSDACVCVLCVFCVCAVASYRGGHRPVLQSGCHCVPPPRRLAGRHAQPGGLPPAHGPHAPGARLSAVPVHVKALTHGSALSELRLFCTRSAQIRAHLHHAGFPIANDAAYGGTAGAQAGAGGDDDAAAAAAADASAAAADAPPADADADDAARFAPRARLAHAAGGEACSGAAADVAAVASPLAPPRALDPHVGGEHSECQDALCTHCPWLAPQGQPHDVTPLLLHACRYAGDGWRFSAPLPPWALSLLPPGDGDGGHAAAGTLPEGLWDALPQEALRRAAAGGGMGDAA
jgi:hypothetical protein